MGCEQFSLTGKTAVVTGGGRGIGAAVARSLTAAGARVTVFSRTRADLEELVARGAAAHWVAGDVAQEADVARLVEEHERVLGPSTPGMAATRGCWAENTRASCPPHPHAR